VLLIRVPGVDREPGVAAVVERREEAARFDRRARVHRVGQRVVDVELVAVAPALAERELQRVVLRVADRALRRERIVLAGVGGRTTPRRCCRLMVAAAPRPPLAASSWRGCCPSPGCGRAAAAAAAPRRLRWVGPPHPETGSPSRGSA